MLPTKRANNNIFVLIMHSTITCGGTCINLFGGFNMYIFFHTKKNLFPRKVLNICSFRNISVP